jgi:hypothetical protein
MGALMSQTWHQAESHGWMCPYLDDLGLPCTLNAGHAEPHQDSGLRAWVASTPATAIVRVYEGSDAEHAYAEETVLFTAAGWRAIAGDDTHRVLELGPSRSQVAVLGVGAALAVNRTTVRRIAVCFARPPLVAPEP